jgi:hypothetical protein
MTPDITIHGPISTGVRFVHPRYGGTALHLLAYPGHALCPGRVVAVGVGFLTLAPLAFLQALWL